MWKTMDEATLKLKKVAELKEIAKTFGLKGCDKMRKAELVAALMKDGEETPVEEKAKPVKKQPLRKRAQKQTAEQPAGEAEADKTEESETRKKGARVSKARKAPEDAVPEKDNKIGRAHV